MIKKAVLFLIRLYQKTLSLDHSWLGFIVSERFCRFHPSCSQYTYEAVSKYGALKGGWLGLKRICRCHPWNKGGIDRVP